MEAFEEHDEAYNGAVAVQKHSFKEEEEEKYGAAVDVILMTQQLEPRRSGKREPGGFETMARREQQLSW